MRADAVVSGAGPVGLPAAELLDSAGVSTASRFRTCRICTGL
ncbi:hypothetical protein ABZ178_27255 [Streptomyces massasporeus]|nr:hypothetical protein [Streptomyces massasporeus]